MIDFVTAMVLGVLLLPWYYLLLLIGMVTIATWMAGDPRNEHRIYALTPFALVLLGVMWYYNNLGAFLTGLLDGTVIAGIIAYMLVGVLWSGYFWYKVQREALNNYLADKQDGDAPRMSLYKPSISDYKDAIVSRILLWPFSMLYHLLSDLAYDAAIWLANRFKWWYEAIQRSVWRGVD